MATTTNYSWTTPDNTAYVKDGASAIRTLGSSVDTTLFTALGGTYPGLRLIKKQTIGSAVASVNVTGAFSAAYDTYLIQIASGVGSGNANLRLQLGSTTTGYYNNTISINAGSGIVGGNTTNVANFDAAGQSNTSQICLNATVTNPFLSKVTTMTSQSTGSTITTPTFSLSGGQLNNTTSYTDFTILTSTGTLTGGTIYVYGYGAS